MLTALLMACGEADVQPSLLPGHFITGFTFCQGLFFHNFRVFFPDTKDTIA
jgi:hypothetical protein